MRLSRGSLKRVLPKAEPMEGDRQVFKTCYCGAAPDEFYVTSPHASRLAGPAGAIPRLSQTYTRRCDAVAEAWRQVAASGGRLLDYQRSTLAEQPFWVRLSMVGVLPEERVYYSRGMAGERHLVNGLHQWCGAPRREVLKWVRALTARGHAEYPLTQTEIARTSEPQVFRAAVAHALIPVLAGISEPCPEQVRRRFNPCSWESTATP